MLVNVFSYMQENHDNVNDCLFHRDILFVSALPTGNNMLVDFENKPRSSIRTR